MKHNLEKCSDYYIDFVIVRNYDIYKDKIKLMAAIKLSKPFSFMLAFGLAEFEVVFFAVERAV